MASASHEGVQTPVSAVVSDGIMSPSGQGVPSDYALFTNATMALVDTSASSTPCFSGSPQCIWLYHGEYRDWTQLTSVYTIFIVLFIVIMALGLAGNAMVIGVVWSHRSMRTPTNYYIVSLAVSDLLVITFAMPLKLVEYAIDVDHSIFNTTLCSFTAFVMPAFVFTSIWTLVAISIDRYLVIIHPLKARSFNTRSRALRTIVIIWLAPFVLLSPYFYPYQALRYHFQSDMGVIQRLICSDRFMEFNHWFTMGYNLYLSGILFVIPVILLGFTCGSIAKRLMSLTEDEKMLKNSVRKEEASRRKVAKMILVVILCFFICWCSFFIVNMLFLFTELLQAKNYIFSLLLIHLMGFANSFMNPVIYALMSQAFRSGFWEILTICCPQYRHLVAPSGRRTDRRSVTAVSQTEVAADRNHAKRGYNRFFRRESTQFSTVSEQDDDHIGMTKLGKSGNRSNNNNRKKAQNPPGPDAERKQRAERLLHKFMDEEPGTTPSDDTTLEKSNECETPLINTHVQDDPSKFDGPPPTHSICAGVVIAHNQHDPAEGGIDDSESTCQKEQAGNLIQMGTDRRGSETHGSLDRVSDSISKCAVWKETNDASALVVGDIVNLMSYAEGHEALAQTTVGTAIKKSSSANMEQLMDSAQCSS